MEVNILVTKKESGASYSPTIVLSDRIALGRDLSSPIQLEGNGISREHFTLITNGKSLFVEDLSSNGTWLNGKALIKHSLREIKDSDVIEVPGYQLEVSLPEQGLVTNTSADAGSPTENVSGRLQWLGPLAAFIPSFSWLEMFVVSAAMCSFFLIWYYMTS